ncbi:unnamed protein product [Phytophthora lilii]|uniref:Unnamed protein product n=1 Tax=Phytophthora lilii TaxID=2077276 RepID=A0A9W6YDB1_9STRA|nr:unnamed protein product [Phytophthora lilii]
MEQSNADSSTVAVVNTSPPSTTVPEPASPSSSSGSPSAMGNRNRSVSMNMHSSAPPSKKQRASDDEYEQATPPPAPVPAPTSPFSAADAVDTASAIHEARDQASDETDAPDVEEDQPGSVPTSVPPFRGDGDSSSDESDVNEEAFLNWLVDQKTAGMPAGQMLDALGLGVSEGVAVDDDELWEAMFSMGIRLIKPAATVCDAVDVLFFLECGSDICVVVDAATTREVGLG